MACEACASALHSFLQDRQTQTSPATATAPAVADATAISSLSTILLELWSSLGLIWGAVAQGDFDANAQVPVQSCMHSWSDPRLQATIQPSFSLCLALVKLHPLRSDSSLFSLTKAPIWDAVFSASAYICSDGIAELSEGVLGAPTEAASTVVTEILRSPHVQQVTCCSWQLVILAAVAAGLHKQHKGMSPAMLYDLAIPNSTAGTDSIISRDQRKQQKHKQQHKQQLTVADHSAQMLPQLE